MGRRANAPDGSERPDRRFPSFGRWIHGIGPDSQAVDPALQIQHHAEHTVVLRQSMALNYEAPFLYLLFGYRAVLLFDTGATSDPGLFPIRRVVDELVDEWRKSRDLGPDYRLVVAHSHSHDDHTAGDSQFLERPSTVIQGVGVDDVIRFYGFPKDDIDNLVSFDLGGRRIEVLRIPGHDAASIAIFDPWTGWILTGDTVYPGRLYVRDSVAFRRSISNLVKLAGARGATALMGCHVEMSTQPGIDYPRGTLWQPDEPGIAMRVSQLGRVADVMYVTENYGRYDFDDFILISEPTRHAVELGLV